MEKPTKKQLTLAGRIHVLALAYHMTGGLDSDDERKVEATAKTWAKKRLKYMGIDVVELKTLTDCLEKAKEILAAKDEAAKYRVG